MTNMLIQPLWLTHFIEILLVPEFQLTKFLVSAFSYKAHFRPQISSNARWLAFLSEYHFELKHIKGKKKKVVKALSWRNHMIYEVTLSQTDADLHEKIRMANKVDPFYVEILKKVQEDWLFQQQKEYKVDDSELLWSKGRLYVPDRGDI